MNEIIHEVKTSFGTIPMVIDNGYPNFEEFYKNEKRNIYIKIVEVFECILKENIKEQKLLVIAKIDGVIFDTSFIISKDNELLLSETILPYFEQAEEYEICKQIIDIQKLFNR